MRNFIYQSPTKIVFGKETQKKTAECVQELGVSCVLIVYGSERVVKSGLLSEVTDTLDTAGIKWDKIGGVVANPRLSLTRKAICKAIEMNAQLILAIGGGSVIDTAKATAIGAATPDVDVWEYWSGKQKVTKALPIGVILTLPAAGSETSDSAVLTNDETKEKRGICTDIQRPKFAIMNPELTYSLPREQVAAGVTDIIMHTLERYFSHWQGNHLSDALAEGLIRTVMQFGPRWLSDPKDYEAMSEVMWAGSVSHINITGLGSQPPEGGRAGDWATHQLGHEISGMFDSTHGATLSSVWGSWARYVCTEDYARFAKLGNALFDMKEEDEKQAAYMAIDRMVEFFHSLGMPTCFSELGIGVLEDDTVKELADNCSFHRTRMIGSCKKLDYDAIYEIYKAANK